MSEPHLVCLIGAECTGKTAMAQALARHFDGLWVSEYLREFCDKQQRAPLQAEQQVILHAQLSRQESVLEQARQLGIAFVFCDTSALLTAIYSDYYFSDKSLYPLAHTLQADYTLTLLLSADLPWQADGVQRDSAAAQARIDTLIERQLGTRYNWQRLAGSGNVRLRAAQQAINLRSQCSPEWARRPA